MILEEREIDRVQIEKKEQLLEYYYECACKKRIKFQREHGCVINDSTRKILLSLAIWIIGCFSSLAVSLAFQHDAGSVIVFHFIGYVFPCCLAVIGFKWVLWKERIKLVLE